MSITRKIVYGGILGLLVLVVGGATALWSTRRLMHTGYWVRHTEQVMAQLNEELAALVDAEDAARAFALSGTPIYLQDFERARARAPLVAASIQRLTADNPTQQARAAALSAASGRLLDDASELVATRRAGGAAAAGRFVATGRIRAASDAARRLVDAMAQDERQLLASRLAADHAASRLVLVVIGGLIGVAAVLVIVGSGLLVRAVTHPIEALARAADRIGRGDLDVEVATGRDEFGRLGAAFNDMVRRRRDAEAALGRVNAFLGGLMRSSPLGIVAIDAAGRCEAWNPSAERIFGWSADEVLGRPLPNIPPEEAEAFAQLRRRALDNHETVSDVECKRLRKDGRLIDVGLSVAPRIDADGHVLGMMAVIEDITDRKAAADALHRSEERFRGLVAEVSDYAILTLDPEGCIVTWNRGAEVMHGWRADEVIGRPLQSLLPSDQAAGCTSLLARARGGRRAAAETWRSRQDGTRFWAHVVVTALHDASGRLVGFTKITQDLTERRQAEEERARTLGEQALLADTTRVIAGTLDTDAAAHHIVNALVPRMADIAFLDTVQDDGELHGLAVAGAVTVEPETLTALERRLGGPIATDSDHPLAQVIRTGRSLRLGPELPDEHDGGAARQLDPSLRAKSALVVPLIARSRIFGTLTLVSRRADRYDARDVTLGEELGRRAALALDNAHLYEEAQRAAAAREELLAVVAHDLKNPLNAIGLRTQLLARQVPEAQPQLALMRRAVQMMQHLINTQLDGASIDAGRFAINAELVPLGPIIDDIFGLLTPLAADRELSLARDRVDDDVIVWCDRARVVQVLSNLVGNAIKFTPPGGHIELACAVADSHVQVTVRDDGPGIREDEVPHLFDRFWRAHGVRAAGSGLGLYIARAIIEAHGGRMWVESTVGHGSAFRFTLPVAPPMAAALARV